jgi:hypothetical protein
MLRHHHRAATVAVAQRQRERVALRVRTIRESPLYEGEYLPAAGIEDHLCSLRRRYPAQVVSTYRPTESSREVARGMPGPEFAYHGSFFEASAQTLRRERLVMVEARSHNRFIPGSGVVSTFVSGRRRSR